MINLLNNNNNNSNNYNYNKVRLGFTASKSVAVLIVYAFLKTSLVTDYSFVPAQIGFAMFTNEQ